MLYCSWSLSCGAFIVTMLDGWEVGDAQSIERRMIEHPSNYVVVTDNALRDKPLCAAFNVRPLHRQPSSRTLCPVSEYEGHVRAWGLRVKRFDLPGPLLHCGGSNFPIP